MYLFIYDAKYKMCLICNKNDGLIVNTYIYILLFVYYTFKLIIFKDNLLYK